MHAHAGDDPLARRALHLGPALPDRLRRLPRSPEEEEVELYLRTEILEMRAGGTFPFLFASWFHECTQVRENQR